MSRALICGSLAFDTIMVFQDQFKNHILPDKVHILNVSFFVPRMRREFGGCAGNIAYNLQALGGQQLQPPLQRPHNVINPQRYRSVAFREFVGGPHEQVQAAPREVQRVREVVNCLSRKVA